MSNRNSVTIESWLEYRHGDGLDRRYFTTKFDAEAWDATTAEERESIIETIVLGFFRRGYRIERSDV
jgi:hypothetical protein